MANQVPEFEVDKAMEHTDLIAREKFSKNARNYLQKLVRYSYDLFVSQR